MTKQVYVNDPEAEVLGVAFAVVDVTPEVTSAPAHVQDMKSAVLTIDALHVAVEFGFVVSIVRVLFVSVQFEFSSLSLQ